MEGGMFVGKQIHLDEQACSVHLNIRATFSPWGWHAHLLESRVAFRIRVVGGGRAGTPSSLYFYRARKPYLMRMPSLWTRSTFYSTAGHVSQEVIEKYIERQSKV